ncbi:hypothetical protein LX36DRAFT_349565 [Colletotrichum falcatum]|nr:hypothetical protein LX36DRAFT_349565 [Colletotrichum falcatum]
MTITEASDGRRRWRGERRWCRNERTNDWATSRCWYEVLVPLGGWKVFVGGRLERCCCPTEQRSKQARKEANGGGRQTLQGGRKEPTLQEWNASEERLPGGRVGRNGQSIFIKPVGAVARGWWLEWVSNQGADCSFPWTASDWLTRVVFFFLSFPKKPSAHYGT